MEVLRAVSLVVGNAAFEPGTFLILPATRVPLSRTECSARWNSPQTTQATAGPPSIARSTTTDQSMSASFMARRTVGGRTGEHSGIRKMTPDHESPENEHAGPARIISGHPRHRIRNRQVTRSSRVAGSKDNNKKRYSIWFRSQRGRVGSQLASTTNRDGLTSDRSPTAMTYS